MAIDVYQVKSGVSGDSKYQSAKGSSGGSDIDFAALMRSGNGNVRVGNGLAAIADKADIIKVADRNDAPARYDDRPQDSGNDRRETYDSADHAPRQEDRSQSAPRDNRDQEHIASADSSHSVPAGETSSPKDTTDKGNRASGEQNDASLTTKPVDRETSSKDGANGSGDTSGKSTNADGKTADQATDGSDHTVINANKGTGSNAEQILSSLLATAHTNILPGNANGPTPSAAKESGPTEKAVNGLSNALASATKNANTAKTGTGAGAAAHQNAAAETAKPTQNDAANRHANQTPKAVPNTQASNAAATAQATAPEATPKDTVALQAAQLSKMVGNGPKVSVSVETKDDSATVVSRPSTSLTSSAALIGENRHGHQPQNVTGQPQAAAGQTPANNAQIQAPTTQAAVQVQTSGSGASDVKGAAQAIQHVGAVAAGTGGEGAVATNTVNATHQTQHSAPKQASSAPRLATPGQAITDQVSVQITKAINAGADKISIQLKPADLGRVDVKMEVGHDGRITAVVTADNRNTLDLLQRDSRELQQALQNAGMQMDNNSLSFNLRERNEQGEQSQTAGTGPIDDGGDGLDAGTGDQRAARPQSIISETRVDIRA